MDIAKNRFLGIPLGVILAIVVNGILFMGLPLLTQIQRSFQSSKTDSSILLTQHKPPKPPDPEKDKKQRKKKPKKLKQKKAQQKKRAKPKIDIPRFDLGMGDGMGGGMQFLSAPRQEFSSSMLRTAFTLSEVDQPPRVIRKIDPLYPFAAKRKGLMGSVMLRFIVTKEGRVVEVSVVKSEPPEVFDASALKAIVRWRFKPAIKDGKSVDVIIMAPLAFKLLK